MKVSLGSFFSFVSLISVTGFFTSAQAFAESRRFILVGEEPTKLARDVHREGGAVDHELRYHRGIVAHLSETAAKRLSSQYGSQVLIEEDAPVFLIGSAERQARSSGGGSSTQPAQTVPWGIHAIRALEAQSLSRGAGITVCVVDTGIQANHPDLQANIAGGENFVFIKGTVDPNKWNDDNGHGTHVSGTIAALDNSIGVVGVAPAARLFAVKVLNRQGSGYMSDVAEGIRSCVAHGARVINMSLGASSDSSLVHGAVIDASASGAIVVAAAGNESTDVSFPAKYPEVLAVSAVDSSLRFASFSNFGPEVDFAAPGVSVFSTYKGSAYATLSGTSMASPHLAGVAALMLSSGSLGLLADDIGLPAAQQGAGLISALRTVMNR